jgi:hypothetical protein
MNAFGSNMFLASKIMNYKYVLVCLSYSFLHGEQHFSSGEILPKKPFKIKILKKR